MSKKTSSTQSSKDAAELIRLRLHKRGLVVVVRRLENECHKWQESLDDIAEEHEKTVTELKATLAKTEEYLGQLRRIYDSSVIENNALKAKAEQRDKWVETLLGKLP